LFQNFEKQADLQSKPVGHKSFKKHEKALGFLNYCTILLIKELVTVTLQEYYDAICIIFGKSDLIQISIKEKLRKQWSY
jgi:hypothetical protein